ncbi:MAG: hypothetical protein WCL59_05680 [Cyanobium sp. ELA507]
MAVSLLSTSGFPRTFPAPRAHGVVLGVPLPQAPARRAVPSARSGRGRAGVAERPQGVPPLPLALAAVLVALAVLVAPEQPRDQEAICHRHAGVEACRVW